MTATETDGELLRRLARGEVQALGGLYDRHARRVYHLLLAHGLDEHEAQDVLQDVFLALMERSPQRDRDQRQPRLQLSRRG